MHRVLVTAPYMIAARAQVEPLFAEHDVELSWATVVERLSEEALLAQLPGFDGVICGDDAISARVLKACPRLRAVVKWGTGVDSIDVEAARARGIKVRRTADAFTGPVADTTLGLMLAFCRSLLISDRALKQGQWSKQQGHTLSERVVGLIGLGNIGTAVARRLRGFGPRVLANDIADKDPGLIQKLGVEMVPKDVIYQQADIISLHCDLNPSSRHLVDTAAFAAMQRRPVLINTARGPLIDEAALIRALESDTISGAGLDVFEQEPLPQDSPLRKMDAVILSAHNSNSSPTCWARVHQNSVDMLMQELKRG